MPVSPTIARFLGNYFDKILVVTVPRYAERHHRVREQLYPLPFEFFYGTDKIALDPERIRLDGTYDERKAIALQRQGKALNPGEIACALSHRSVYAAMIRYNWKRVLVMEDDVVPLYDKLALLPGAFAELPGDWELLYLGYLKHERVTPGLKLKQVFYTVLSHLHGMKWNPGMISRLLPRPYSPHLKRAGFHDCTHAYAITLAAARKLVNLQTPVAYRSDDLLSYTTLRGELNAFVTEPKFFNQEVFHELVHLH